MGELARALLETTAAWVAGLTAIAGGASALIVWSWRRIKAISDVSARDAMEPFKATLKRLEQVESDVNQTTHDVANLRTALNALGTRTGRIETTLESVARKEDVAALHREFVEFRGGTAADLRQVSSMVHSITAAILRAGEGTK